MSLIIYIYIPAHISALLDIASIYTACPHVASHYSFFTHHGRQRCKRVYMETKIKKIKSKK